MGLPPPVAEGTDAGGGRRGHRGGRAGRELRETGRARPTQKPHHGSKERQRDKLWGHQESPDPSTPRELRMPGAGAGCPWGSLRDEGGAKNQHRRLNRTEVRD